MNSRLLNAVSSPRLTFALGLAGAGFVALSLAPALLQDSDPLEGLPHANAGAYEGGATGTEEDTAEESFFTEDNLPGGKVPTDGKPSPLYGAQPFTQQILRFEEFGRDAMPEVYTAGGSFPMPATAQDMPDPHALDAFLAGPMYPAPMRQANDIDENPWRERIEEFLGRALDTPPAEGRPPGEGWAHQRWEEFYPEVVYQTAQAGARQNLGMRDHKQMHGYAQGEFAPGGLYHNVTGLPGSEGTAAGIDIRFHPNMPIQNPHSLWTFDGTLPPKLLMARYGEPLLMRHYNALPIDPSANRGFGLHTISTHEHNGHTPAESDGYTNAFFFPGQYYDYRWPMALAGTDTINVDATDPRAAMPTEDGGTRLIPGDWRETMSTHWFHDHMLDYTAQNVYKGNAVMMNYYSALDRGNEAIDDGVNLRLPSGSAMSWGNRDYDVNLLVADKAWTDDGQLWFNIFNTDGFVGDQLLTNWLYKPYMEVRARKYRFRILNGSVSRYVKIALVDQDNNRVPFHMVANDGNIMEHTVAFDGSLGTQRGVLPVQAIAERYDIVVDFSNFEEGDRLYFVNLQEHTGGRRPDDVIPLNEVLSGAYQAVNQGDEWDGDPCVGKFMELRVRSYDGVDLSMNPEEFVRGKKKLIPLNRPSEEELAAATHREFVFGRSSGTDNLPWTVKTDGGAGFTMDPRRLSAAANLEVTPEGMSEVEVWRLENGGGGWSHPIHIHFEEGIILRRDDQLPPEWERWARKDVYRVGNHEESSDTVDVAIRFREFAGSYMEHCHNTQHEDRAMLLRYDIENPGQVTYMPTPIPTWDGVEYVDTVALPTARSGGGTGSGVFGPAFDPNDADSSEFHLSLTPARAGEVNTLLAQGGVEGTNTFFVFGHTPGQFSPSTPNCPGGVEIGLSDGAVVWHSQVTNGAASFSGMVPPEMAGQTMYLRAANLTNCESSNLMRVTFPLAIQGLQDESGVAGRDTRVGLNAPQSR